MPPGRISTYTPELAEEICSRLSTGQTLRQICRDEHMPSESTVRGWVVDDRRGFYAQYARARELCIESWADEIVEIAENGDNDWMTRETESGRIEKQYNGDHIQRSKLRVDSRRWLLSKMKPEKYGDRLELAGGLEIKMNDDQLDSRLTQLLGKAGIDPSAGGEGETESET